MNADLQAREEVLDTWSLSAANVAKAGFSQTTSKLRQRCGFAGCTSPWSRLWRRHGRPGFQGRWGCSKACVRGLIDGAMRRESHDGHTATHVSEHRHRVPLGLVLLAQGWITHPQLQHALAMQKAAGRGRIGDWLVEECGVRESDVTRGLGVQWNCPVLPAAGFHAQAMALVMPAGLCAEFGFVPVRVAARRMLYVGSENGMDASLALALERMSDLTVECGLMEATELRGCASELTQAAGVLCHEETVDSVDAAKEKMASALQTSQPVDARLTRWRDRYWMRMWLEPAAAGVVGTLPRTGEDVIDHVYRVRQLVAGARLS